MTTARTVVAAGRARRRRGVSLCALCLASSRLRGLVEQPPTGGGRQWQSAASTSAVRFATRSRARCAKPDSERSRLAQIVSRVGTLWHAATNLPHAGAILYVTAMQISVARIRSSPVALHAEPHARPYRAAAIVPALPRLAASSEPRGSPAGRDIRLRETEYRAIPKAGTEVHHATDRAAPTIFRNQRTAYAPNICRASRAVHRCRRLPPSP
jgi:hypothetical protein